MSAAVLTPEAVRAERRRALLLLGLMAALFSSFAWFYVRRLNNYVIGDAEFTGWTGPFAARLASGERPYLDFVLPIPPGSFVVLAAVQELVAGPERLLEELFLIAACQLSMALIAYAIAVELTSRQNAVLVAIGTLVLVLQMPKECAYDGTAQVAAWSSLAFGVRALLAESGPRRRRFWVMTGFLAAFTFAFKQSTGTGVVFGWLLAFAYLGLVARFGRASPSASIPSDARAWSLGALGGALSVLLLVLSVGSSPPAFWQAIFVDGPALKGGTSTLLANLANHATLHGTFPSGLFFTMALIGVGMRVAQREQALVTGDESRLRPSLGWRQTLAIAALLVAVFGVATALLVAEVRRLPQSVLAVALELRRVPMFGLALGIAYFVGQLLAPKNLSVSRLERGHAQNCLFLVALATSLLHALSFVHFFPFYNNDALIPLAFVFLLTAASQARLPWLKAALIVLCVGSLFGLKYNRALSADTRVSSGHWAGLRVNYRGRELLAAAERVHRFAGPKDSVLVLPEDAQLSSLIGRPRPPLRGAIVFVDQYPERLAVEDMASLDRNLPNVIVIHPGHRPHWQRLYATWGRNSGAERVLVHVLDDVLPRHYRRDSSFRTVYFWDQGRLEVWVRNDVVEH